MARLIRPDGHIYVVKPRHGSTFTRPELFSLVGFDFEIIELMSEDLLLYEKNGVDINKFASRLAHKEIKGTAFLADPGEID